MNSYAQRDDFFDDFPSEDEKKKGYTFDKRRKSSVSSTASSSVTSDSDSSEDEKEIPRNSFKASGLGSDLPSKGMGRVVENSKSEDTMKVVINLNQMGKPPPPRNRPSSASSVASGVLGTNDFNLNPLDDKYEELRQILEQDLPGNKKLKKKARALLAKRQDMPVYSHSTGRKLQPQLRRPKSANLRQVKNHDGYLGSNYDAAQNHQNQIVGGVYLIDATRDPEQSKRVTFVNLADDVPPPKGGQKKGWHANVSKGNFPPARRRPQSASQLYYKAGTEAAAFENQREMLYHERSSHRRALGLNNGSVRRTSSLSGLSTPSRTWSRPSSAKWTPKQSRPTSAKTKTPKQSRPSRKKSPAPTPRSRSNSSHSESPPPKEEKKKKSRRPTSSEATAETSPARSKSGERVKGSDHQLKHTENESIKEWLKKKNKMTRKQKADERKKQKEERKEAQEKVEEKYERQEKSAKKVDEWMKKKRRQLRIERRRQRDEEETTDQDSPKSKDDSESKPRTSANSDKRDIKVAGKNGRKCGFLAVLKEEEEKSQRRTPTKVNVEYAEVRPSTSQGAPRSARSFKGKKKKTPPPPETEDPRLSYDKWLANKRLRDKENRRSQKADVEEKDKEKDPQEKELVSAVARRRIDNIKNKKQRIDTGLVEIDDEANKSVEERLQGRRVKSARPSYRLESDPSPRSKSATPRLKHKQNPTPKRALRTKSPKPPFQSEASERINYQRESWEKFSDHVWDKLNEESDDETTHEAQPETVKAPDETIDQPLEVQPSQSLSPEPEQTMESNSEAPNETIEETQTSGTQPQKESNPIDEDPACQNEPQPAFITESETNDVIDADNEATNQKEENKSDTERQDEVVKEADETKVEPVTESGETQGKTDLGDKPEQKSDDTAEDSEQPSDGTQRSVLDFGPDFAAEVAEEAKEVIEAMMGNIGPEAIKQPESTPVIEQMSDPKD